MFEAKFFSPHTIIPYFVVCQYQYSIAHKIWSRGSGLSNPQLLEFVSVYKSMYNNDRKSLQLMLRTSLQNPCSVRYRLRLDLDSEQELRPPIWGNRPPLK